MDEGIPDLSVVCPTCGSQVSPYITECPYCGNRVQKRAPKLGSREDPANKAKRRAKRQARVRRRMPTLPSIPSDGRLIIVPGLVLLAATLSILVRAGFVKALTVEVVGHLNGDWPKLLTAPLVHRNLPYAFIVLVAFAIFGSIIERRHGSGWLMVLMTWLIAGVGGAWLSAEMTIGPASGALAPAVAVTLAYGMAALDRRREGDDVDLAGVGVTLAVLLLLPPLVLSATWSEVLAGLIVGIGLGSLLTVLGRRA